MGKTLPITLVLLAACGGGDDGAGVQDAPPVTPDTSQGSCLPLGATGAFYRRDPNPKLVAGGHMFSDNKVDTRLMNPDLLWDASASVWHLYYESPHGDFGSAPTTVVRHATSPDLATWTFSEAAAMTAVGEPSVVITASGFVMAYGASGSIGIATSTNGTSFVDKGIVLQRTDVYPGSTAGSLGDPEIAYVDGTYHLWFSSSSTAGTAAAHGISHATSTDAMTWTVQEAPVRSLLRAAATLTSGFDAPSVIYDDVHCRWEIWFADNTSTSSQPVQMDNQTGVLHASSNNGTSWNADFMNRDLTWDATKDGEAQGLMIGADVGIKSTGRYMAYPAFDDQNVPSGALLPTSATPVPSVMTLNLATRDAPL